MMVVMMVRLQLCLLLATDVVTKLFQQRAQLDSASSGEFLQRSHLEKLPEIIYDFLICLD